MTEETENNEDTQCFSDNGPESVNLNRIAELAFIKKLIDFFIFIKKEADLLRLEYEIENSVTLDEEALEAYEKKKTQLFAELSKWDHIKFDSEIRTCSCFDANEGECSVAKRRTSGFTHFCVLVVLNIQMFLLRCKRIINKMWPSP